MPSCTPMTILFCFEKDVTKMVSCCIVFNLTTKPMPNFLDW